MGNYKEIKGDLIQLAKDGEFDLIGHGCNCFATMGAGIAKFIKDAFPEAYHADQKWNAQPIDRLGCFTVGIHPLRKVDKKLYVVNFYSQYNPGRDLDTVALRLSLRKLVREMKDSDMMEFKIGLPLIGCGIAGGDWKEVSQIIKEELGELDVTIVKLE